MKRSSSPYFIRCAPAILPLQPYLFHLTASLQVIPFALFLGAAGLPLYQRWQMIRANHNRFLLQVCSLHHFSSAIAFLSYSLPSEKVQRGAASSQITSSPPSNNLLTNTPLLPHAQAMRARALGSRRSRRSKSGDGDSDGDGDGDV